VRSTNGAWEAVEFQARSKGQHELYKLLRLASCALYLDPNCQTPLIAKAIAAGPAHASSAVGAPMRDLIARSSTRKGGDEPTGPGTARGGLRPEAYLVAPLTLEVTALLHLLLRFFCSYFIPMIPVLSHLSQCPIILRCYFLTLPCLTFLL